MKRVSTSYVSQSERHLKLMANFNLLSLKSVHRDSLTTSQTPELPSHTSSSNGRITRQKSPPPLRKSTEKRDQYSPSLHPPLAHVILHSLHFRIPSTSSPHADALLHVSLQLRLRLLVGDNRDHQRTRIVTPSHLRLKKGEKRKFSTFIPQPLRTGSTTKSKPSTE